MRAKEPTKAGELCKLKDGREVYVIFVNRPGNGYAVHVSPLHPKEYAASPLDERSLESYPWHKFRKLLVDVVPF